MFAQLNERIKEHVRRSLYLIMNFKILRNFLRFLSMKSLIPKFIWKRLPVEIVFEVKLKNGISFLYSSTRHDAIGRALFWKGVAGFEGETTAEFIRHIENANVFIDIGANTGVYSLIAMAVNPIVKVIAFEPVERVRKHLEMNIEINNFCNRCIIRSEAVANCKGISKFHIPYSELPTSASLSYGGFRGYEGDLVDCWLISIDDFVDENNIKEVDIVKIDVEGFEDLVLEGMKTIMLKYRPKIFVEVNKDGPYPRIEEILSYYNYSYHWLTKKGPIVMSKLIPDEKESYRNYLCIKR